jgi:integrase
MSIEKNIELIKQYSELQYEIIKILYLHGLRISEVLDISIYDHIKEDIWLIRVKKGGDNTTITISNWKKILMLSGGLNGKLFGSINRQTIHRTCVKYSLTIKKKNSVKNATTHSFRNNNAKLLMQKFGSSEIVKDIMNHKSKKSQETYLKN